MKKNKKKMFLLFVFFPLLIALGISTWIIVTYDSTKPKYNANSQYFIDYNGKTGVYSGEQQGPTSDSGNLVDLSNVKFKHRLISDSINNYDDGLPIDAGEYFIYIESTTDSSLSTDIYFKIEPFKFRVGVIEQDYSSSTRNWSDIRDGFNSEKVKFYEEDGITELTNLPSGYEDYINVNNLDMTITDGINVFNSSSSGNLIGSTYLLEYFMPNTKNYAVYDAKTDSYNSRYDSNTKEFIGSTLFKYNTVKTTINNTSNVYCTIEDALIKGTGNIILCGDETSNSSYVQTSFTSLNYAYNTLTYDLDGRTLIVPADSSNSELITSSLSNIVYSVLKIPSGITLNVKNNGIINVSAFINTSTIVERRGIIMNDGTIDVISGEVRSYGYIKSSSQNSNGIIKFQSGSTAIDCMTIHDYPGGNTTSKLKDYTLPISAWTLHNISCKEEIIGKTIYKVYIRLTAASSPTTITIEESFAIINGTNPLFVSNDETSKITKTSKNKSGNTELYSIVGSNQLREQRDELIIDGNYDDSIFEVSKGSITMKTGSNTVCPIGFLDITLNSGTLKLVNTDYLFMPDTYLRVKENAKLYIGDGIDLSFEKIENLNSVVSQRPSGSGQVFTNFHTCNTDAKLYLSGEIELHTNGRIGGLIIPEKKDVNINFSSTTNLSTSYYAKQHAVDARSTGYVAYKITKHPASGHIISSQNETPNGEEYCFTNSNYTSIEIDNNYFWVGAKGASASTTLSVDSIKSSPSCLAEGTLITMADGSTKKVEELNVGDMLLVFNHEKGSFDVSPLLVNVHALQEEIEINTINLKFSNGNTLKIVGDHGLFDLTVGKYVYINEHNYFEYIGHKFASLDSNNNSMNPTKLIDVTIVFEKIKVYNPASVWHLNVVANNMLTLSSGMINFFTYDDTMKYDTEKMINDINKYGLYVYDDFKDYISEEVFKAFPFAYYKVVVEKGEISFEHILWLISFYNDSSSIK